MNKEIINEMRRLFDIMNSCDQEMEYPLTAQDTDLENLPVPFFLYDVDFSFKKPPQIKKITVTRYGILPGEPSPSIDFIDDSGESITSMANIFYLSEADAQRLIDIELENIKYARAKSELINRLFEHMPQLFDLIKCDE